MRGEGVLLCLAVAAGCATVEPRGTGDLGIVVERNYFFGALRRSPLKVLSTSGFASACGTWHAVHW